MEGVRSRAIRERLSAGVSMRRFIAGVAIVSVAMATLVVGPFLSVAAANHPAGSCLDLAPETDTNPVGATHEITATLRTASGTTCGSAQTAVQPSNGAVTIHFELSGVNDPDAGNSLTSPDLTCTIQPSRSDCTISYSGSTAGTDTIRGWVEEVAGSGDADEQEGQAENTTPGRVAEADTTDVVTKTWSNPSTASNLDCSPETALNPVNTSHTIGCTARDSAGALLANALIDIEATGVNDPDATNSPTSPDFTCQTTAQGTCQFTHGTGTTTAGTTTYRAWVDADGSNATTEADAAEGQDEVGQPGTVAESDNTDVVTKTWTAGPASELDCDDQTGPDTERESNPGTGSSDPSSAETYTCVVTDSFNNPVSGAFLVRGEVETAVNDPDNPDSNSPTSPDYSCTTANGSCQITVTQAENELGATTICFWVGTTQEGATLCGAETLTENAAQDGSDTGNDFADEVEKTWVSVTTATRLDCGQETDTNPVGTSHSITCTAVNAQNSPVSGANIDFETTGANDADAANSPTTPDFTCTTTAAGTCTITDATGNTTPGVTTYRAWIDRDASNATTEADTTEGRDEATTPGTKAEIDDTDVVTKTWLGPPSRITISPTSDSASVGTCNEYTITVTDTANQGISNLVVDVEQVHQLATDTIANNEPTVAFCTPTAGPNPTSVDVNAGDRRPPSETPDNAGTAGGETVARTDASGRVTVGISVSSSNGADGTGSVTVTAFYETGSDDDPGTGDLVTTATKSWVTPQGRTIDCLPKQSTTPTGGSVVVSCVVLDRFGQPVSGEVVVFTESGSGRLTSATEAVTNASGQVSVAATSLDPGAQTVVATLQDDLSGAEPVEIDDCDRAANDPAGAPAGTCSSAVGITWTQAAVATVILTPDERTTRVGGRSTFVFRAFDAAGQPIAGVDVTWAYEGQGRLVSRSVETDATGVATAVLRSTAPGNGLLTATASGCNGGCVDSSVQHWGPARCTIFGTNGSDVLRSGSGPAVICGFGGNDTLVGGGSADTLLGGAGRDTLRGGDSGDRLKGGGGNDRLFGGGGGDLLYGGRGDDLLDGGAAIDGCRPGPGDDAMRECERSIAGGRKQT